MQRLHATIENTDHFVEGQAGLHLKLRVLIDRALDILCLSDALPSTFERNTPGLDRFREPLIKADTPGTVLRSSS